MNDLDIARLRVYVTQPEVTPIYRYTGTCKPKTLYCNVLRLTTRGGVEGVAGALSGDYYSPEEYDENCALDHDDAYIDAEPAPPDWLEECDDDCASCFNAEEDADVLGFQWDVEPDAAHSAPGLLP